MWVGLLAVLFIPIPFACAWQGTSLDVGTMSRRADAVIRGQVLDRVCRTDDAGRIYTQVLLRVLEVWKGSNNRTELRIVHSGGQWQGETVRVTGQVQYDVGEEVVAFVVWNQRGEGVTVGLSQGKFSVIGDDMPSALSVTPPKGRLDSPNQKTAVRPSDSTVLPLVQLRRRVQEAIR
jgi:hypothetical protein